MNIAIQGIKGAYHHIVAENYFGNNITINECLTFDEMPKKLLSKKSDYLVMAIENSIAGSILANYKLIDEFNLKIIGEQYLTIAHQLMALPNQKISEITEIRSHPMAINQCRDFLRKYPHIKVIEDQDTAVTAKNIRNKKLKGIAAIASVKAAELYNLEIIAKNIQSVSNNFTRFFILNQNIKNKEYNKASLKFITKHQKGSLAEVLQIFVKNDINLSKIQSLPIAEQPWKYAFFTDILFTEKKQLENSITQLKKVVENIKVLGKYHNNNTL